MKDHPSIHERKEHCVVCETLMPHDQTVECDLCGCRVCAPGTYSQDCCSRTQETGQNHDDWLTICRNCED